MAFEIDFDLTINAPASTVWQVITDFPAYGQWNPFCIACASNLKVGEPIDMMVKLVGKPQAQREVIFKHIAGKHLSYGLDGGQLKAIISNRSHDVIALSPTQTRYQSHFMLSGWLMPVVRLLLKSRLEAGFKGMSMGIKNRAEFLSVNNSSAP